MVFHSSSVSARWTSALLVVPALVALAPALSAQNDEDDAYEGESPDRYASVRVLEGDATIRKGEVEEALSRGVPVAEGDVVESHGRGVLQLADGTRIAFGAGTRFQIATLFADQDQDHQVLLRLDYGRRRVAMGRESGAEIRIDMPSGSARLSEGASASLELEQDRTARLKVFSGRVQFRNEREQASLLAGERLTVYSDQDRLDRIQDFNTYGGDAFETWCDSALTVRRGPSWDRVPPELRAYSDDLDHNGEWVYVDEYRTWCWRPLRVSAEWRPYWQGRWGAYPGGMTWISDEPWGYVTYHHGRWGWGAGLGWYWVPGASYAPAWVAWHTSGAYFGWAPMGFYGRPVSWGFGAWGGGICWNVVEINLIHVEHIHTRTHRDHGVIRSFEPSAHGPAGRPLAPPWQRRPLMVHQDEFRDPVRFQRVLQNPGESRTRLHAYEERIRRPLHGRPLNTQPPLPIVVRSVEPRPLGRPQVQSRTLPGTTRILPRKPTLRSPGPVVSGSSQPSINPPLPPPPPRSKKLPGTVRPLPQEHPIQPHGPADSGADQPTVHLPLPPPRSGKHPEARQTLPQDQPVQSPDSGSDRPPILLPPPLKKKRSLGRP